MQVALIIKSVYNCQHTEISKATILKYCKVGGFMLSKMLCTTGNEGPYIKWLVLKNESPYQVHIIVNLANCIFNLIFQ